MRFLALTLLTALLAGCSVIRSCPTDDLYNYMTCAKPSFPLGDETEDEAFQVMSYYTRFLCEDEPSEWLPEMEKSIRHTFPKVKMLIRRGETLNDSLPYQITRDEQPLESLDDEELYRAVVAMHLFTPVMIGMRNVTPHLQQGKTCDGPSDCEPLMTQNCAEAYKFARETNEVIEYMRE